MSWQSIEALIEDREALRRLLDEHRMLKETIEESPAPFCVYDRHDNLVAWNASYQRAHAKAFERFAEDPEAEPLRYEDLIRLQLEDVTPPERLEAAIAARVGHHRKADGTPFEYEYDSMGWLRITKYRTPSGAVAGLAVDVSELKERERQLDDARRAAEAAVTVKADFLANMSHEIRTPMSGVLGMIDLLLDTELSEEQRRIAAIVQDSASGLLTIINDILDYSRLEERGYELETVPFELARVLGGVASVLEPKIREKGLAFTVETDPRTPDWLLGDPTRIRQILFNLLGNAVKFTEQGAIQVATRHRVLGDGRVEIRCEIRDSGVGIPASAQGELFKRFSQADNSTARKFGGTGLGLAICKQLVELMDGRIGLESEPGRGSLFWFTLRCPRGEKPAPAPDPRLGAGQEGAEGMPPLHLLVAEDNRVNQLLIATLLSRQGLTHDLVGNGSEALAAVQERNYDLVLMDVQMPEMDGIAATRAIRALDHAAARIPIVALTANVLPGDRERYLAAGMDDYVSKPIDPEALKRAIRGCHRSRYEAPAEDAEQGPSYLARLG